jgi:DNA invertase Pin-like site-specific DNA recombinase
VKSVNWSISLLSHSESPRFLQVVDNIIHVLISTFIFMFIFDMMSVRAYFDSQDLMENLKRQIRIARMKYGFIIVYWVVVSTLIFIFYNAYLSETKYRSF